MRLLANRQENTCAGRSVNA
ncbi:hypothetical protein ACQ9TZ_003526 [Escherichia coli]